MNRLLSGLEDKTAEWKKGLQLYTKEKTRLAWKKPPTVKLITHHDIQTKEHQYNPIIHRYSSLKQENEAKAREHAISLNVKRSHVFALADIISQPPSVACHAANYVNYQKTNSAFNT